MNLGVLMESLNKQGFAVSPIAVNDVGFTEITNQLYDVVNGKGNKSESYYLEEVYDDYIIYRKRKIENNGDGEIGVSEFVGLYKQKYQVGADDKIELVGDPVEVKKNVSYVTLSEHTKRKRTKFNNNNKGGDNMACEKCPEKVEALINNSATYFNESDREWLSELAEDKLDKLIPKKAKVEVDKDQGKTKISEDDAWEVLKLNKEQYQKGVEIYNQQRAEVTKEILDNSEKDTWKEEDLKELKLDVLKKIAKSFEKKEDEVGNYAGMGAGSVGGGNGEGDDPYIPEIEFADKK